MRKWGKRWKPPFSFLPETFASRVWPMKSMTGYGWGESARDGFKVTVELSSVNRKQGEISTNLPRELEVLEAQVRDLINQFIARGRVTARVSLHATPKLESSRIQLNHVLAQAYAREINKLAKILKLSGPVPLDVILRAPGVMQTKEEEADAEAFWPGVKKALDQALRKLVRMREREGAHLKKDLCERVALLRKTVVRVKRQAPLVQKRYRKALLERLRNADLAEIGANDERVIKELMFFADRSDITEELTRLESHFQQFEECVRSHEPVGRTLDFLAQEMNREINTLGSKANDSLISKEVVILKTELEKFREQAQNVE